MGTGQGKLPLDVVTDNALRKKKYEQDELEGTQPLMVTTSSDGGSAVAPIGNTPAARVLSRQARGYLSSLIIIGDSITSQNSQDLSNSISYMDTGYLTWALGLAGVQIDFVRNAGIAGDTIQMIADRMASDVIPYQADAALVQGGINGVTTITPEAQFAILRDQIWAPLIARGSYVIDTATPPRTIADGITNLRVARLNALRAQYWRDRADGEFVDWYSDLTDTTNTACPYKTSYALDSPPTHPSNLGAYVMGEKLAPVLQRLFRSRALIASPADTRQLDATSNNIIDNPLFLGTGGTNGAGCSGTLAASWLGLCTGGVTAVHSTGAANSGVGQKQIAALTATASGYYMLYTASVHSRAVVADIIDAAARIKISSASNLNAIYLSLTSNTGSLVWGRKAGASQAVLPSDFELLAAQTKKGTLFAGTTSLQFTVRAEFAGAGSATFEIERAELRNFGQ